MSQITKDQWSFTTQTRPERSLMQYDIQWKEGSEISHTVKVLCPVATLSITTPMWAQNHKSEQGHI